MPKSEIFYKFNDIGFFPLNFDIVVENQNYSVNKALAITKSKYIANWCYENVNSKTIFLKIDDDTNSFYLIADLLRGKTIRITQHKINFLDNISSFLEIDELKDKLKSIKEYYQTIEQISNNDPNINILINIERKLFTNDLEKFLQESLERYDNDTISIFLANYICLFPLKIDNLISLIDANLKIKIFSQLKKDFFIKETNFILSESYNLKFWLSSFEILLIDDNVDLLGHYISNNIIDVNQKVNSKVFTLIEEIHIIDAAAYLSAVQCFKYLMINGASFTYKTPLFAVAGGSNEIVRICEQNHLSFTGTMDVAAKFHKHQILEWIIINEIDQSSDFDGAALACIDYSSFLCYKIFLSHGISLNENGISHLSKAAQIDNIYAFNFILSIPNIDINERGEGGLTAFHFACKSDKPQFFESLIKMNMCDINIKTGYFGDHNTPLHIACKKAKDNYIQQLLKRDDIKINETNRNGTTAFLKACKHCNLKIVQLMFDCGADLEKKNTNNESAFHYACKGNNLEVVKYLIENCTININDVDNMNQSGFMFACKYGSYDVAKFLLTIKNLNQDLVSVYFYLFQVEGRSAFHYAISSGNLEIVKLLSHNANKMNFKDIYLKYLWFWCIYNYS